MNSVELVGERPINFADHPQLEENAALRLASKAQSAGASSPKPRAGLGVSGREQRNVMIMPRQFFRDV
jgi:hypothetical protein